MAILVGGTVLSATSPVLQDDVGMLAVILAVGVGGFAARRLSRTGWWLMPLWLLAPILVWLVWILGGFFVHEIG